MAVLKKRLEYCQDEDEFLCYFRATQGHSGGVPMSPELMKYTTCSIRLENVPLSHRKSMGFSVYFGEWNNTRRTKLVKLSF